MANDTSTAGGTYPKVGDFVEYIGDGTVKQGPVTHSMGKWVQVADGKVLEPGQWKFVRAARPGG